MSALKTLSEIPTLSSLYKLGRLTAIKSTSEPNQSFNDRISLIRYDITKLQVDAIVNAANESLLGGGGVDGAIHRAAGPGLVKECETLDGCETGWAKITNAYELPCKKVVHAVGPVYFSTKRQGTHTKLLKSCYRQSLTLAVENDVKSIAFSALSTGVYGYPSGEAAEAAIEEVRDFLSGSQGNKLDRVIFCSFMEKDEKAYDQIIPKFFPPVDSSNAGEDKAEAAGESTTAQPVVEEQPAAKKTKMNHTDLGELDNLARSDGTAMNDIEAQAVQRSTVYEHDSTWCLVESER